MPPTPPQAVAVEVLAAQPTDADDAVIARLNQTADREIPPVAYLVRIRLQTVPPATSSGWALYIDDFRVPKYWQFADGIYFKVYDPQFFADHAGESLRFTPNGIDFIETGLTLAAPDTATAAGNARRLPRQSDLLA